MYAVGAARPSAIATTASAAATRPRKLGEIATTTAMPKPAINTMLRSIGNQSGVRFNNTNDHSAVIAMTKPRNTRTKGSSRRAQKVVAPMPTIAPIAGASATE